MGSEMYSDSPPSDAADAAANSGTQDDGPRDEILDSAIKVFSQKGFDGAGLREIARHAGVNHAMIKYYFGNKEQLWKASVNFLFQRQLRELNPESIFTGGGGDPRQSLRRTCERLIRYWARYPEHGRLIMQASMTPGPCLDWLIAQTRKNHALFQAAFAREAGTNAGEDVNSVAMLYLIVGACQTIFTLEHEVRGLYGIDVSDPVFIDEFVKLVTDVLAPPPGDNGAISGASSSESAAPVMQTRRTGAGLELRILIPDP